MKVYEYSVLSFRWGETHFKGKPARLGSTSHESTPSARKSTSSARVALAGTRRVLTPQNLAYRGEK